MIRKIIYALTITLIYLPQSFASYERLNDRSFEEVSIYTPQRLGFNGSITTIPLKDVNVGPSDKHFYLAASQAAPVSKKSMAFTSHTLYVLSSQGREQTYSLAFQRQIKERISTYGIARLTFDSYDEQCRRLGYGHILDSLHIGLNPHDQVCKVGPRNAYYQRTGQIGGQGLVEFCSRGLSTAKIFDITAHEIGHSILDALRPNFYGKSNNHPYSALHESFGDLSALFASIRLAQFVHPEEIPLFIESPDFCLASGLSDSKTCLRNPATYRGNSCEAHDHSNYLTSFILNSMSRTFTNLEFTIENAVWTSNIFQRLLISTVVNTESFSSLDHFSKLMIDRVSKLTSNYLLNSIVAESMSIELKKLSSYMSCPIPRALPKTQYAFWPN